MRQDKHSSHSKYFKRNGLVREPFFVSLPPLISLHHVTFTYSSYCVVLEMKRWTDPPRPVIEFEALIEFKPTSASFLKPHPVFNKNIVLSHLSADLLPLGREWAGLQLFKGQTESQTAHSGGWSQKSCPLPFPVGRATDQQPPPWVERERG